MSASTDSTVVNHNDNNDDDGPSPITSPQSNRIKNRRFGGFQLEGKRTRSTAQVQPSGYVDVSLHHDENLSHVLSSAVESQVREQHIALKKKKTLPAQFDNFKNIPPLCIVIQIVGSRGDVQPFISLGSALQDEPYNHRVRLCTHPAFKDFVEENGLEFFSIGGDPEQLMSYMVKNPGIMPGKESLMNGDIPKRRAGVAESLEAAWRSCIEPSEEPSKEAKARIGHGGQTGKTFIADAIIANPVSFAHIHCAEKLHIPLHLMFTMPWSPTQAFPHPLAQIKATNVDKPVANFLSYSLMELITFQGLGDIINSFRIRTLALEPVSALWGGGLVSRLLVPHTYAWSTALIPKPSDWGPHIGISGFFFLELGSKYKPPQDLLDFLEAGEQPIYIGFGSIVIDDPEGLTNMIFEAVKATGVRCLLSKGWSKLGGSSPPDNVFLLDNCPHDWLFPQVKAVVHHGGAGTCAIGVKLGKPTVVVPFFGDQAFWGAMIYRAGAGPEPVPFHDMTAKSLTHSIRYALRPATQDKAKEMARQIEQEDGAAEGARQFQDALPLEHMRCMAVPGKLAVWHVKHTKVRLSAFAASVLMHERLIPRNSLERIKWKEWNLAEGPRGPLSGGIASVVGTLTDIMLGVGHLSHQIVKTSVAELSHPHIHHIHRPPKEVETLEPVPSHPHVNSDRHLPHYQQHQQQTVEAHEDAGSSSITGDVESGTTRGTSPDNDTAGHTSLADTKAQAKKDETLAGTSDMLNPAQRPPTSLLNEEETKLEKEPETPGKRRWHRSQTHEALHLYSRKNVAAAFPGLLANSGINTSVWREHRQQEKLSRSISDSRRQTSESSLRKDIREMAYTTGYLTTTLITWPIDLTYNLASGFHNAPILFCGDDTVRKNVKIVDVKSGLYAMGREVTLGLWDGTTGLVTQPYRGAQKDGAVGFVKGVGKGLGGLVFKTGAAIFAIPGYSLKGLEKQLGSSRGTKTYEYIRNIRHLQGLKEFEASTPEQREAVRLAFERIPAKERLPRFRFV